MTPAVHGAQLFLLASGSFLVIGALLSAAVAHLGRSHLEGLDPHARHRALLLLASLPVLSAATLLVSASLPSIVALADPTRDHCLAHDDEHAHLCFVHPPEEAIEAWLQLGLVFCLTYLGARAVLSATNLRRATQLVRGLAQTGERRRDLGATVIETAEPICVSAGLLRPRVLISRGMLELFGDDERAIVLAHERAHVRRRDALTSCLARACATFHLPGTARWILGELELAAEQICDEEAAAISGDRLAVAATILRAERAAQGGLLGSAPDPAIARFGAGCLERRVASLLATPPAPATLRPLYYAAALSATVLLASADPLHHTTETLLSFIAH